MSLHHELADLVHNAGPLVLEDADALRAALDDFLAEHAASEGEVNLLVDAVRLGAVSRFVDQLGHGADAALAVDLHGDRLASARGTQEASGARWALAALGYALGMVDEEEVLRRAAQRGPAPAPPAHPAPLASPAMPAPPTLRPPQDVQTLGGETPRTSRAPLALIAIAVVVVIGMVAGLGFWLTQRDDDAADDDTPSAAGSDDGNAADSEPEDPTDQERSNAGTEPTGSSALIDETARLEVLDVATEFAASFNTYGPDGLDADGHLPDYAATATLMTDRFGAIFRENIALAEQTVSQIGVSSTATVHGAGVNALGDESAVVLVGSVVELAYPDPQGGDDVSTGPQLARYVIHMVFERGSWLVDNVDDVDDGLPPFGSPQGATEPSPPPPDFPEDEWPAEVAGAVETALPAMLSYDYRTIDSDLADASAHATDEFAETRAAFFEDGLGDAIVDQQVVVESEVLTLGLGARNSEQVAVLVFVDQESSKSGGEARRLQMWATVSMVLDDGTWLVDDIQTR